MRTPNVFTNPATGDDYEWPLNHSPDGEDEFGAGRPIDHTATTNGGGTIRQQGAEEPMLLRLQGTILERAHHDKMVEWAELGRDQTIVFTNALGESYEVLVTTFKSRKVGVVRNLRGGTDAPLHKWTYTLEMDVVSVLSGTWS